jgi:GAF domain-containing protein
MNSLDHIARVFPDHALIASLGCQSSLNLPIVVGGSVIGTINQLHEAGFYTPERVAFAKGLGLAGAAAFLLAVTIPEKDKT